MIMMLDLAHLQYNGEGLLRHLLKIAMKQQDLHGKLMSLKKKHGDMFKLKLPPNGI